MLSYLSPSSIQTYREDRREFFLKYILRVARIPQNQAMSVGSAFDAYVKGHIQQAIFGRNGMTAEYFESQVEPQNRDWARTAGAYAFNEYRDSGALDELIDELASATEVEMEFKVRREIQGIPLLGIPDLKYVMPSGLRIILDWKVMGFCSKYNCSPWKGYKIDRYTGKTHKDWGNRTHKGYDVCEKWYFHEAIKTYAIQLAVYGWLLGTPVGDEFVAAIDQLACKGADRAACGASYPEIRVVSHRLVMQKDFQEDLITEIQEIWDDVRHGDWSEFDELREAYSDGDDLFQAMTRA